MKKILVNILNSHYLFLSILGVYLVSLALNPPFLPRILTGIIILMILVLPLSRIIVGTTIGSTASIVPLSISAAPFVARIVEGAVKEVDRGLLEAS